MDKRENLNPQISLDIDPMEDPSHDEFRVPKGWTKDEISFYFDRALKVLNSDNFTTAKEYVDLLVNQCLAEKHWSEAFTYFLTKIKEYGLEVETAQDRFNTIQDHVFYWRAVRMMIHAAGLVRFEDEIMKYEIAKFYQPAPPMLPPPRVREVPVASRRRPTPPAQAKAPGTVSNPGGPTVNRPASSPSNPAQAKRPPSSPRR